MNTESNTKQQVHKTHLDERCRSQTKQRGRGAGRRGVGDTGATLPIRASAFPTPVRPTLLYIYIGGKFWVIRIVLKYKGKGERGEKTRETSRGGGRGGRSSGSSPKLGQKRHTKTIQSQNLGVNICNFHTVLILTD
jgi:hypothetical protein